MNFNDLSGKYIEVSARMNKLEDAIRKHKEAMIKMGEDNDEEPTKYDLELWKAIE